MDHVVRQDHLRNVFLIIDDPRHLARIETKLIDQNAAGPHASGYRIGAHADHLAFEILGMLDPRIRPHEQTAMMELAEDEKGQCHEGRPIGTCDNISGWRKLTNIELHLPHHAAEGGDLRLDADEFGLNPFNLD